MLQNIYRPRRPSLVAARDLGISVIGFPGQPSNPVGFFATPANVAGLGNPAYSGDALGSGLTPASIGDGTSGTFQLTNGAIISFKDFTPKSGLWYNCINNNGNAFNGGGGAAVNNVTFIGCRFTANSYPLGLPSNMNPDCFVDCFTCGSSNIKFLYCTIAPTVALNPHPIPATAWPSSGVGTGRSAFNSSVYQVPYLNSARDCISIFAPPGTTITIDHCDIWGGGEIVGVGGGSWAAGQTPATVNGNTIVTDNWLHDNRLPIAPPWSSGTNYAVDAIVSGSDFNNYRANTPSGPGNGGALDPTVDIPVFFVGAVGTRWTGFATFDHGNGIIPTNSNPPHAAANWLIQHNTLSGLGNTNSMNCAHIGTVGTFWNSGSNYAINAEVGASDGFRYVAAAASGPGNGGAVNPAGNTHPTVWTQWAFNGYQNMVIRNNWISGFNDGIDIGVCNSGQTGMIFEDNIISNDVMWFNFICMFEGTGNSGPYQPYMDAIGQNGMFTSAPTNSWRRNKYHLYPGSGSTYDVANANNDGKFVWPDGSINSTDWPN